MIQERDYRVYFDPDLEQHQLVVGETDLMICLPACLWDEALRHKCQEKIIETRAQLQNFISEYPLFASSHQPLVLPVFAPTVARKMAEAAAIAGVGPMAAVAGYFSQLVGRQILELVHPNTVIVENGGDIFLHSGTARLIGIYAGERSPFSGKIAVKLQPEQLPSGICTSSGTVGSSFSYGRADAAMIVAADTVLADAVATAAGNLVQKPEDVAAACDFAMGIAGVSAALIIAKDKLAAAGEIELVQL